MPTIDTLSPHASSLRPAAMSCAREADAQRKAAGTIALANAWRAGALLLDGGQKLTCERFSPGRPARPELISPKLVRQRSMQTAAGRAAMMHALTHIEFNAINLALDAIWRFDGMPPAYYADWLNVAAEEALHFSLLENHLHALGWRYGDFPAHNSLWEMAEKTASDVLARMALVPRTLEARGLDASPRMRAKLAQAGDLAAAEILDIILRDEIGHVAIGNRWYRFLCAQRTLDPVETYSKLALQYKAPVLRGPFNVDARRAAGFTDAELAALNKPYGEPG
jgi:uncharacterized ferritin-like protein (DUF455 family)